MKIPRFTIYDKDVKSVLQLIKKLGNIVNQVIDGFNSKTDLYGDHKGSWQGLNRPTMSEEGMRSAVEKMYLEQIPSLNYKFDKKDISQLSDNLISTTWTLGTNWSGDASTGFTHTTGSTEVLENQLEAIAGKVYLLELTVEDTDTLNSGFKFKCTIGDSDPFEMYQGVGNTITYRKGIRAINDGTLKIIPNTDFTGTIKNISVKEVLTTSIGNLAIMDDGEVAFELRPSESELSNVFIGRRNGQYNVTGYENTSIGNNSMDKNVSGFWNSTLGRNALQSNINGSRNIALGYNALQGNISGHRNVAIGTFALNRLTTGAYNIGIGSDSAWYTTTGNYNIALGVVSLDKNTTGSGNIAIGYNALRDNETTSYNIAIGHWTLRENKAHNNTAIGSRAMNKNTTGTGNTSLGYETMIENVTGSNNTVIGQWSGKTLQGSGNTFLGRNTGVDMTTGDNNILIGNGVTLPTGTHNTINIGNLFYGGILNKKVGIGIQAPDGYLHLPGGTAGTPSLKLEPGTLTSVLKPGSIEYDGTDFYITTPSGRKKIATTS